MRLTSILAVAVLTVVVTGCGGGDGTSPGEAAVDTVDVTPAAASMLVGESRGFVATARSASGQVLTGRSTSWSSSNTSVATVSASGTTTGIAAGTSQVVATIEGVVGQASLTVNNPVPAITALVPSSGVAGTGAFTLVVTGTGFMPGLVVRWNGEPRPTTRASGTEASATIGAADIGVAGSAQVSVYNAAPGGGSSSALPFAIVAPNPVPVAATLTPAQVIAANTPFTLTVTGTGFTAASVVRWDGAARPTTRVSGTQLTAAIPGTDVVSARTVDVTVFTPAPGGGTSAPLTFTVNNPAPTVSSIAPSVTLAGGPGFTLTVTGAGFRSTSVVRWNGASRPTTVVSGSQLTAMIPATDIAAFGSANVTVVNPGPGGGTSAVRQLTINAPPAAGFVALAAGDTHTCGLTQTRQAWCWGEGTFLHAFTTTPPVAFAPVPVAGTRVWGQVATGPYHTCALTLQGAAWCWGSDDNGQLGQGAMIDRPTPVAVTGGHSFQVLAAGGESLLRFHTYGFTCGLDRQGKAWCWGANPSGQLGNGTLVDSHTAVAVAGSRVFTSIAAGDHHACGLTPAGAAWCWGLNMNGQLGDGTFDNRNVPVAVGGGHVFTSLSLGNRESCGVTVAGAVYCWGAVDLIFRHTPIAVAAGHTFVTLATSGNHRCGLKAGGAAWCWGGNLHGELGTGGVGSSQVPVPVAGGYSFASISTGYQHTCGITAGGQTLCWGLGSEGALGNGGAANRLIPTLVTGAHNFASISAHWSRTCAVTTLGAAWCWGPGSDGQRGDNVSLNLLTPAQAPTSTGYATLAAGGHVFSGPFTCAATSAGAGSCWGSNIAGSLGNGSLNASESPVDVAGGLAFTSIDAARAGACGLATSGAAWCWGANATGRLGTGNTHDSPVPVAVVGGHVFRSISAGTWHTCGVTMAGAAYCWGANDGGQLGTGTLLPSLTPVPVIGGHVFASISASGGENILSAGGSGHTCGVTTMGQLYCWGDNVTSAVGPGPTGLVTTPMLVSNSLTFSAVGAGEIHTCALAANGAPYCWGTNLFGVLGAGSGLTVSAQPVVVSGGRTYTSLSVGRYHACALTASGEAFCWGNGHRGRLGNGTVGDQFTPTPVSTALSRRRPW